MKIFLLILSLIPLFSVLVVGQTKINYSGEWTLDKEKSSLAQIGDLESMRMQVAQTENEIIVTTTTKFPPVPIPKPVESNTKGVSFGLYDIKRGYVGDGTYKYSLDGEEKTVEVKDDFQKMPVNLKAFFEDDLLKLQTIRIFRGQGRELFSKAIETWKLSDDGKTLNIRREIEFGNFGKQQINLVFTKN